MKNWQKYLLLILVLSPSFFFLGRAFADNMAQLEEGQLELSGPGAFSVALADVDSLSLTDTLPQTAGTGGFALGWIKKGNFIRQSDQKQVRILKNSATPFIYLRAQEEEYYFSLSSPEGTQQLYRQLQAAQK
jgi:hypothetical protein